MDEFARFVTQVFALLSSELIRRISRQRLPRAQRILILGLAWPADASFFEAVAHPIVFRYPGRTRSVELWVGRGGGVGSAGRIGAVASDPAGAARCDIEHRPGG